MLTYSFADIGSDSLYEHLYKCIKSDIITGILRPGEKMPSKRSFAKNLGISVITVENAYEQLISEGYLYSIAKKGFFVSDLNNLTKERPLKVSVETVKMTSGKTRYVADFASNRVPKDQFPFSIWSKLLRECLNEYQESLLISSPSGGSLELRGAIVEYLKEFRGMHVDPEQIIIGAGTESLYGQIVQLLGHDKIYGVEDPGFLKMAQVYEANAVTCKYIPFEKDGISIEELVKQGVQVAHTSPSHHFPTGVVTPISKRYELLGWAAKDDSRYIIEDDYDSEFRFVGKPIPTLQSIDTMEKVIYLNTFSKSIANTFRISYMVLPKQLVNRYYEKLSFYSCPVTTLIQFSLAKFIQDGYFEKHINRMRNYYRKQRDLLVDAIHNSELARIAAISEEDAGLHFLLHLKLNCSDQEWKERMERRGIRMCALSEYYKMQENKTEHIFVINYSSLTEEQILEAVALINQELNG